MVAQEFESYRSIVHLKVHGLQAVALESKCFIIMKMNQLGLPLQLQRKSDGKLWIPKWMIIYEFVSRTLSQFECGFIRPYLMIFEWSISMKDSLQNYKGKSLHTRWDGSEKKVRLVSHLPCIVNRGICVQPHKFVSINYPLHRGKVCCHSKPLMITCSWSIYSISNYRFL